MLLTTDWHPWFSYEWWNDIGVPALGAVGSIAVGAGAIIVAYRSHHLAERVRGDEQKREAKAAQDRYRDQLFQNIEAIATALLSHRAELVRAESTGDAAERNLRSDATIRLKLAHVTLDAEDRAAINAGIEAYRAANKTGDWKIMGTVAGELAVHLSSLLDKERDVPDILTRIGDLVAKATKRWAPAPSPASEPQPTSAE